MTQYKSNKIKCDREYDHSYLFGLKDYFQNNPRIHSITDGVKKCKVHSHLCCSKWFLGYSTHKLIGFLTSHNSQADGFQGWHAVWVKVKEAEKEWEKWTKDGSGWIPSLVAALFLLSQIRWAPLWLRWSCPALSYSHRLVENTLTNQVFDSS